MILKFNFGAIAIANIYILKVEDDMFSLAWRTTAIQILFQARMVGNKGSLFTIENITKTLKKL